MHGLNGTPRASTFVGIAVHWPAAGSVERVLLGLASKLLLLIDLHASCQLSVFELVAKRG